MSMSFDPDDKDIGEAHTLVLEPLPPLTMGAKPLSKNDEDASSRSESPMLPTTPAKSAQPIPKVRETVSQLYLSTVSSLRHFKFSNQPDCCLLLTSTYRYPAPSRNLDLHQIPPRLPRCHPLKIKHRLRPPKRLLYRRPI